MPDARCVGFQLASGHGVVASEPYPHCHGMSTEGHSHQLNTNINPQFSVRWRRKLYSVQTTQLWHSTAEKTALLLGDPVARWPWNEVPWGQATPPVPVLDSCTLLLAGLLCSVPYQLGLVCAELVCSPLLWWDIFSVSFSVLVRKTQPVVLHGKTKCTDFNWIINRLFFSF